MKKLTQLLKESQHLDYRRMNVGEEEDGQGMTKEEKRAFVEAVAAYRQLGEMISHKGNISEIHDSIKGIVENANNLTLKETGDWFDRVTVQRHMKSMNESFKVFSNTIKEVSTLQQRLESSYDEIGEVLGKYYEIKEGNEFGAERAKAIAGNKDSFEVDGKSYKVTGVDAEDKKNAEEFANESMKLTSLIKRNEELTGKQKELDVDSDGDIEADDLADLRAGKKADESVNEGVSPSDMDKIKGAVEAASSFMSVGSELKKLGMKYTFATEPLPIYIIQPTPNNKVAIVNKKYATKPDFVVGDIAVGIMEGKLNEEEIKWDAVQNVIINFLKMNTKILDKRVQAKDTNGVKGGLKSIISGLVNAQRNLKLESVNEGKKRFKQQDGIGSSKYTISYHDGKKKHKDGSDFFDIKIFKNKPELEAFKKDLVSKGFVSESVNEASYVSGYTVKAKNPYEFVNGAYAVLSAYLRDEELGPKGKRELQDIIKSLEYMRKYFFFKMSESVNEGVKLSLVDPNTNKFIKTLSLDRTYKEAEKEVETLNRRLSSSEKTKGLYWKVTSIGESVVNEDIEPQLQKIASLTGLHPQAIKQFGFLQGLNFTKILKFIEKGKLKDRMDFVTAVVGNPGNPIQKKMIKMFQESVNEASTNWETHFKEFNEKELKVIQKFILMNPKGIDGVIEMSKKKDFKPFIQKAAKSGLGESVDERIVKEKVK